MNTPILYILALCSLVVGHAAYSQQSETRVQQSSTDSLQQILTFEEYLGYVKQYHPLIKQANLQLSVGEATLLRARGGFDPKIEVDYDRKKFKGTEYYDQLNGAFKIPTWYGIELNAKYEENSGQFLDPSLTVPEDGLYSAGVSFSLAQGFLMNERMAMLKKARVFMDQTEADRTLLVNTLIFEASKAYFEWAEAANEQDIYENFLQNALIRYEGVQRNVEVGEKAAIDATEARIIYQTRQLDLEAAQLKKRKAALKTSNFLWLNEVPLEIQDDVQPELPTMQMLDASLRLQTNQMQNDLETNHPKLRSLTAKIEGLAIDRRLKRNKLLPKLDLQYNFLTQEAEQVNTLNTANYKVGVNFSFPLFLRKERGEVQLAKYKLQDATFERMSVTVELQNKIEATRVEIASLTEQNALILDMAGNYRKLLIAEERKFELGESSLFLINSREQKLIEILLKANALQVKLLHANASLFNVLGVSIE
ncbi:TolC family protein [Aquimarina intermedia]|uniref:Outer membrane protein TolC n=1 Tax=Aquimarina intermedia TaxID=350814 RepID=A0A5S5C4Y4_9FLAO|nr:TolC family protein [Aquimarina intermedia]TYP73658.1 outer membrane protein TolC [Aquimarina intermedia]